MDTRRRRCLEAMGIDLWERREPVPAPEPAVAEQAGAEQPAFAGREAPLALPPEPLDGPGPSAGADWEGLIQGIATCEQCPELVTNRSRAVPGVGNRRAELMVIGEAPGAEEDRQGEPFVGRAGQLLDNILRAAGYPRPSVYIANVLKCRPPDNRDPLPEEAHACGEFLRRQIALVAPRAILVVGRIAAQNLLNTESAIGRLRGTVHQLPGSSTPVVVTYHPAYLLRSPAEKRKVWQDLKLLRKVMHEAGTAR